MKKTFAGRLKSAFGKDSLEDVAEKTKIPKSTLGRYVKKINEPNVFASLRKISAAYNVTVGWLVNEESPKRPNMPVTNHDAKMQREDIRKDLGNEIPLVIEPPPDKLQKIVDQNKQLNPHHKDMTKWISEQNDGIDYWAVAKAKLARDFPEFKEWLKKTRMPELSASTGRE